MSYRGLTLFLCLTMMYNLWKSKMFGKELAVWIVYIDEIMSDKDHLRIYNDMDNNFYLVRQYIFSTGYRKINISYFWGTKMYLITVQ